MISIPREVISGDIKETFPGSGVFRAYFLLDTKREDPDWHAQG